MSRKKEAKSKVDEPIYRLRDAGKIVKGCDGYFTPSESTLGRALRPGKTYEDSLPKEQRPRYQAWLERLEKSQNA